MTTAVKFGGASTKYELNRRKYKLLPTSKVLADGTILYRIQCLHSFAGAARDEIGGWIQHEGNLSHDGDCWVAGDAMVYGGAAVTKNGRVQDNAIISGSATVTEDAAVGAAARVNGWAVITGTARVVGMSSVGGSATVTGYARIDGTGGCDIQGGYFEDECQIVGDVVVKGRPRISGSAKVHGDVHISGYSRIYGDATIISIMSEHLIVPDIEARAGFERGVYVSGNARIYGDATIAGHVKVGGDTEVFGHAYIAGYATITDKAIVRDNAQVYKQPYIGGLSVVGDNCQIDGYPYIVGKSRILGSAVISGHAYIYGYGKAKDGVMITGNTCVGGYSTILGSVVLNGSYPRRHIDGKTEFSYRDVLTGKVVIFTRPGEVPLIPLTCESKWGTHLSGNVTLWSGSAAYYTDVQMGLAYATIVRIHSGRSISYRNIRKREPVDFYGEWGLDYPNILSATINVNGRSYPVVVGDGTWSLTVPADVLAHNVDYRLAELNNSELSQSFYTVEHHKDIKRIRATYQAELLIEFSVAPDMNSFWVRATKDIVVSVRQPTPLAPKARLEKDTGRSDSDRITNDPFLIIESEEADIGTVGEYSLDGGNTWNVVQGGKVALPDGKYNQQNVLMRCRDEFGNVSVVVPLYDTITIDTTIEAPRQYLSEDTGASSTDSISNRGDYNVVGLEAGLKTWYAISPSTQWVEFTNTFVLDQGQYDAGTIKIKAEDVAGNSVVFGNPFRVTIDKSISVVSNYSEANQNKVINQQGSGIEKLDLSIQLDGPHDKITSMFIRDSSDALHDLPINSLTVDSTGRVITELDVSSYPDGYLNVFTTVEDLAGNKQISGTSILKDTTTFISVSLDPASDTGASASDFVTNKQMVVFNGAGEPGSKVTLTINGVMFGSAVVNGAGSFTFTSQPLPEGSNKLVFEAEDVYTNKSSTEITLVVDKSPPQYALSRVAIDPSKPRIAGYSEPNVKLNLYTSDLMYVGSWNSDDAGLFSVPLYAEANERVYIIEAEDRAGNTTRLQYQLVITSWGNDDTTPNAAGVVNGSLSYHASRGLTVFAMNQSSQVFFFRSYDTFASGDESNLASAAIESLKLNPDTKFLGVVTQDEWVTNLNDTLKRSLEDIDVPWLTIVNPEYRSSLAYMCEKVNDRWQSVLSSYMPRYSSVPNTTSFERGSVRIPGTLSNIDLMEQGLQDELVGKWAFSNDLSGTGSHQWVKVGDGVSVDNGCLVLTESSIQMQNPYLHMMDLSVVLDVLIPNQQLTDYDIIFNYEGEWELALINTANGDMEFVWAIWGNAGTSWEWVTTGVHIQNDVWYNIGYIYDHLTCEFSLYIDGVLKYTSTFTRRVNLSCGVLTIGGRGCTIGSTTSVISLSVKNVGIWSRPLMLEEIQHIEENRAG